MVTLQTFTYVKPFHLGQIHQKSPEVNSARVLFYLGKKFWEGDTTDRLRVVPFFLRDSTASETRARVNITPREKISPSRLAFLAWVIFTRARVSLALLSLRNNGDYS